MKTRFCPSPTGLLHLGNMRTALFNALLASANKGIFLLRIEDTDKTRSKLQYIEHLKADLRWLGLPWHEGPDYDLGKGPYWQSQRQAIYDTYYQQLTAEKRVYPCFCTEEDLKLIRKKQLASGKPPRYIGTCRTLTTETIQQKLAQGLKPVLRFQVIPKQNTVFQDLVRKEQCFNHKDISDFIIRRADGTSPFIYCNAIDDALMGVTHVLRGEDHLTNTPRQIMLLKALNFPIPIYGHISLIIGADNAPLSKRNGSYSIQALQETGYLPMAILNYLARLGHHYTQEHWLNLTELANFFSVKSLGSAPARFDISQLLRWQHESLLQLSAESLWEWMGDNVRSMVPLNQSQIFLETIRPNIIFPADAQKWARCFYTDEWIGEETAQAQSVLKNAGPSFFTSAAEIICKPEIQLEDIMTHLKNALDLKGKQLFQPLRVALTGDMAGPELVQILKILGPKRAAQRLIKASLRVVDLKIPDFFQSDGT